MSVVFSGTSTGAAGGVQQAYELTHTALVEGQFADIADNTVGTYINESGGVLPFGDLVVVNTGGTVGNSAKTIAATGDSVLGVHGRTYIEETAVDGNSRLGASSTQAVNVLTEGKVAVYVTGAVDFTSPVRVFYAASGAITGAYAGRFSGTFVSGKTMRLSNARWASKTTGAGLAILELNGPSFSLSADS